MANNNKQSDMIRLGGLWENQSAAGTTYLSGTLGGGKLLAFRNTFKKDGSNDPDWILYIAPRAERRDDEDTTRMPPVDDDGRPSEIPF